LEFLNNVVALKNSLGLALSHDTHTVVEQLGQSDLLSAVVIAGTTLTPDRPKRGPRRLIAPSEPCMHKPPISPRKRFRVTTYG
jgi:hypothetical protein